MKVKKTMLITQSVTSVILRKMIYTEYEVVFSFSKHNPIYIFTLQLCVIVMCV